MCVHLEKDEVRPGFDMGQFRYITKPNDLNSRVWYSFCRNYRQNNFWRSDVYNTHGHVGFAWGARREVLERVPLYDKALIGGADHIIAHAAVGQINHPCITKSFTDNIEEVNEWSQRFFEETQGYVSYVPGNLFHIWHGDVSKRQYT